MVVVVATGHQQDLDSRPDSLLPSNALSRTEATPWRQISIPTHPPAGPQRIRHIAHPAQKPPSTSAHPHNRPTRSQRTPAGTARALITPNAATATATAAAIPVKTLTLRIPDVEAAMLQEVQKTNQSFRDLQGVLLGLIRQDYQKTPAGKTSK